MSEDENVDNNFDLQIESSHGSKKTDNDLLQPIFEQNKESSSNANSSINREPRPLYATSINNDDSNMEEDAFTYDHNHEEFLPNYNKEIVYPSQATYEDPTMVNLYNQNQKIMNKSVMSNKSAKIIFESNLLKHQKNTSEHTSMITSTMKSGTVKSGGGSSGYGDLTNNNMNIHSTVKIKMDLQQQIDAQRFQSLASFNSVNMQQPRITTASSAGGLGLAIVDTNEGRKQTKYSAGGGIMETQASKETNLQGRYQIGQRRYGKDTPIQTVSSGISSHLPHNYINDSVLTKVSDFGKSGRWKICFQRFCVLMYILLILSLTFHHKVFNIDDPIKQYITSVTGSYFFYLLYLPIVNIFLTKIIGNYVLAAVLFPYQNAFIREALDRTNATKFGEEFAHYLESFVYTIRIQAGMSGRRSSVNRSSGKTESQGESVPTEDDFSDEEYEYLTFTEMKNTIDLLILYISINEEVIQTKQTLPKFKEFTDNMKVIKQSLMKIFVKEPKETAQQAFQRLKDGKTKSKQQSINKPKQNLWDYFVESQKVRASPREGAILPGQAPGGAPSRSESLINSQAVAQQEVPNIGNDQNNLVEIDALEDAVDKFSDMVIKSSKTRNTIGRVLCYYLCCFKCICCRNKCRRFYNQDIYQSTNDTVFGDLLQCKLIMQRNFGGKHFMIPSSNGHPPIDCMFFPATHGDIVTLDPEDIMNDSIFQVNSPSNVMQTQSTRKVSTKTDNSSDKLSVGAFLQNKPKLKKYLEKPTILMSSPNALIYQWMVTSANAYWLDFFLRRECNVFIWNYRGYGESQQSMFQPNYTLSEQRVDAERVMQFLVNRIRVKGKIGVYGRSIGGIAAAHLSNKFPDIVQTVILDRTVGVFDAAIDMRFPRSSYAVKLVQWISGYRPIDNSIGLLRNPTAYKILASDDQDDVFDSFSQVPMAVAQRIKTEKYQSNEWKQFYESLMMVFKIEKDLHEIESQNKDEDELSEQDVGQRRLSELFSVANSEYIEILKSIDQAEISLKNLPYSIHSSKDFSIKEEALSGKGSLSQKNSIKSETKFSFSMEIGEVEEQLQEKVILSQSLLNNSKNDLDSILSLEYISKTWGNRRKRTKNVSDLESNEELVKDKISIYKVLHQIILVLSDFDAGCTNLQRVVGNQHKHEFKKFKQWLQLLEVYGCGYDDDNDPKNYKLRDQESHCQTAQKTLYHIVKMYQIAIEQMKSDRFSISTQRYSQMSSSVLKQQFRLLLEFQKKMFIRLLQIQENIEINSVQGVKEDFQILPQGHLVKLTCGHRGIPYRGEEKRISRLLRKSGFIPMLETREEQSRKQFKKEKLELANLESDGLLAQDGENGFLYIPVQTPMKQEFNANRMSAKKEVEDQSKYINVKTKEFNFE